MGARIKPVVIALAIIACVSAEVFAETSQLKVYGYFSTRYEQVYQEPALDANSMTIYEDAPGEWSHPSYNLMFQQELGENFRAFVNLNGAGASNVDIRNMWGEFAFNRMLCFRVGKMYRKFGLYNEILDAVPTYIGIEPPELFDNDHLMISRTTQFMVHGSYDVPSGIVNYSVSTDNGEGDPVKGVHPTGFDVFYNTSGDALTVGTSVYLANGRQVPDKSVGDGSPRSGILPWMQNDDFQVFGGYLQVKYQSVIFQSAYWQSPHDARRDPASIVSVIDNAGISERQMERFLVDPNGLVEEDNVRVPVKYDVKTWYVRAGYSFDLQLGQIVPYGQWDWYSNPETIASKTWGGDNEAGVADDGQFQKGTVGIVYRPITQVAVKLDGSSHFYKFNGKNESYPEIRFDVSYVFGF